MGNCTTRSLLGYEELRNSIPGSLISDHDFDLFYSLCKIETIGSISSALHPSKNQLFYVVISGQVVVHLTSSKIPNICATTFYSGDMIHFFNSPINSVTKHDINCIRNGNIALSLQFKGYTEKMGRVIGIDKINFEKFLMSRFEHKQPLVTLLSINMSDLMKESGLLHSMTLKQMNMLGPLLKIRLAAKGGLVCFPLRLNSEMPRNYTSGGTVAVVLFGTATSVPITQNTDAWADRLRKESPSSASTKGSRRKPESLVGSIARFVNGTPRMNRENLEVSLRSVRFPFRTTTPAGGGGLGDSNHKPHLTLLQPPGSVLGLDAFFMRNPELIVRKHLVTSNYAVLGYIPPKILDAFCEVDPRFLRILSRNYHRIVLNSVKFAVPMLSGLEDASYERLSHRVCLKSFAAGSTIYTQGQLAEYAYIMIFGAVSISRAEREEIQEVDLSEEQGGAGEGVREQGGADEGVRESLGQILTWSAIFGDVALVTNSPYFNTAVAIEPTAVLAISKSAFEDVYYENKTKLCEIRIRQVGKNVELQHVIDHPRGSEAFKKFLIKAMAVENLLFYLAVDRFDSMCLTVSKMFAEVRKYRSKIENNQSMIAEQQQQQTLSDDIPSVSQSPSHIVGKRVNSPLFNSHAQGNNATVESAVSIDSNAQSHIDQDNKRNSQYMETLFAELDSHVGLQRTQAGHHPIITPSSPAPDSYESDADTDIGEASSVVLPTDTAAPLHFSTHSNQRHRRNSSSGVSVSSVIEDDLDTIPPCNPLNVSQETAVIEDDHAVLPVRKKPSPSGTYNTDIITKETTETDKSALLPHNINLGTLHISSTQSADKIMQHHTQCRNQATLEQEQLAALVESNQHLNDHNPVHPAVPIKTLIEQNTELYGKVHRRMGKLRQSIIELREVARQIMETYVHVNAPNQVNISSTTRTKMEQMFREWSISSYSNSRLLKRGLTKTNSINGGITTATVGASAGIGEPVGVIGGCGLDTISTINTPASGVIAPFTARDNSQLLSAAPSPAPIATITRGASMVGPGSSSVHNHTFPTTTTAGSIGGGGATAAAGGGGATTAAGGGGATTAAGARHTDQQQQQQPLQPQAEEVDKLNFDFTTLFLEAKSEVLKLLKQDNFPRWQRTEEFTQFIDTMIAKDVLPTQAAKDEEIIQAKEYSSLLTTVALKRNASVESFSVSCGERKSAPRTALSTTATTTKAAPAATTTTKAAPAATTTTKAAISTSGCKGRVGGTSLGAYVSGSPSILSFAFGGAVRSNKVEPGSSSSSPRHNNASNTTTVAGPGSNSGVVTAFTPPPPDRSSK